MSDFLQVTTNVNSRDVAMDIASVLVQKRLAACAHVRGPMVSQYWWHGTLETVEEWVCEAETSAELYPAVEAAIRERHPYEVPSIVAVPLVNGSKDYFAWLRGELRIPPAERAE